MKSPRNVLILANPKAGGFSPAMLAGVSARLRLRGVDIHLRITKHAGEIEELLSSRNDYGFDCVAIHGGDGAMREAAVGLHARVGKSMPTPVLALLPGGTANVLAHELQLPLRDPEALADIIANGDVTDLHYALANGAPFLLMVSAGLDAHAVHNVSAGLKKCFGKLAYIAAAAKALPQKRASLMIEMDNARKQARLAIVSNSACYGGRTRLTNATGVTQPGLRLVTLERDNLSDLARLGVAALSGAISNAPNVNDCCVSDVTIAGDRPTPVQIDGDAFGVTPVKIQPAATPLKILARR
jgi:YegS/Rv2252/BmrU family lipid kinase